MSDFKITEKIENKKLIDLMAVIRDDSSEENMANLLREAAVSTFIVPVTVTASGVGLHAVTNEKNQSFMVVYADSDTFENASEGNPNPQGVTARFEDLMEAVTTNPSFEGFVINPGVEEVLFGKEMLDMIKKQMGAGEETAKIGLPDKYPPKLLSMLEEFAKDEPRINAVWVRLMRMESGNLRWLLVTDDSCDESSLAYMLDTLKRFIMPYMDGIDVMVISSKEEYISKVIEGKNPFWKR